MVDDERPDEDIDPAELRVWIEFGAWCAFVMTPIIWWLQGPSVSTDQFVVRSGLVVISLLVAVTMRIWAIVAPASAPAAASETSGATVAPSHCAPDSTAPPENLEHA